jgi:hypothetical protein
MSIISKYAVDGFKTASDMIINKKPCDITYDITNGSPFYTEPDKSSIYATFDALRGVHLLFNSIDGMSDLALLDISAHSLVVEAYVSAAISTNDWPDDPYELGDGLPCVPMSKLCWDYLKKIIDDLLKKGYTIDDDWRKAIFG